MITISFMNGGKFIALVVSILITTITVSAQKLSLEYKIEKDTVQQGKMYKNDVTVSLAEGDSILFYDVRLSYLNIPDIEGNTAHVRFIPVFNSSYSVRVLENHYALRIKLKTLRVDTVINTNFKYYVLPNPAYVQWQGDASLQNALIYPDTPAMLISQTHNLKEMVSSAFLKDQKGTLAFSFLIDANGRASKLSIRYNTFTTLTKEQLQQFIYRTSWTPAKDKGKIVKTVYGVYLYKP